jgi:hypothetical protein
MGVLWGGRGGLSNQKNASGVKELLAKGRKFSHTVGTFATSHQEF